MNMPIQMLTEIDASLLAQAFPLSLREEAQVAADLVAKRLTAAQWTEQFGLLVNNEQVLLPSRLRFVVDDDVPQPGSDMWLMVRALHSRSNDGFERQRATRDLLTDIRPWTAPFIVALIGEYIAEILIDIDVAMLPGPVAVVGDFIFANPVFWETTKRRVHSYFNVYHQQKYSRLTYAGFRLIQKLEAAQELRRMLSQ